MPSTFTWLDYSEHERRKMLDVIELFGERTTRDELGLGGVRDAFADILFPGTSTIQTRAKYFLLIPWIYLVLEGKRTSSANVGIRARRLEVELMTAIDESEDSAGLIGRRAREKVLRLASSIYWQGLLIWGIRRFSGSQEQYHRSLDTFYAKEDVRVHSRSEYDGESTGEGGSCNWHPGLPEVPDDFPEGQSFALERAEAEYLRERVLTQCPRSLLAWILGRKMSVDQIVFAWELRAEAPPDLSEQLVHGRNFSETIHGAQLLYNLMLAELRKWSELIDEYRELLTAWQEQLNERWQELVRWDRRRFWQIVQKGNPRLSSRARSFVNQWLEQLLGGAFDFKFSAGSPSRQLILQRETQLKGGLARLRNERALELWPGAAGAGQLELRWNSAKGIVQDILVGLEEAKDA